MKNIETQTVQLRYELHKLPSAQHKAGLAGLVLQIQSLVARNSFHEEDKPILSVSPYQVDLRISKRGLGQVMDDLYDAETVEQTVKSKWQGKEPKRCETVETINPQNQKATSEKFFVYDVNVPKFTALYNCFPDTGRELWIKLWRDAFWSTTRAVPATRNPYDKRAERQECGLTDNIWKDLVKQQQQLLKGKVVTAPVASSLFIGCQANNAENLEFDGLPDENLLLNFWPLTVGVYCPRALVKGGKAESKGYLFAFPEISDLEDFLDGYRGSLATLDSRKVGYRPAGCLIDLPDQGGLEFLRQLSQTAQAKGKRAFCGVTSVDFYHLEKGGNNVKGLAFGKVAFREDLLVAYQEVMEYQSFLFRRCSLKSILAETTWYYFLSNELCRQADHLFLAKSDESEPSWEGIKFTQDCRQRFKLINDKIEDQRKRGPVVETEPEIEAIVYRLVRKYLLLRTEDKTGISLKDLPTEQVDGQAKPVIPEKFKVERQRLGRNLFLEMRSRRGSQFIQHFSATLAAVPQFLREQEFIALTKALQTKPDDIKTLTMLALSANS